MTDEFEKASRFRENELPPDEVGALQASGTLNEKLKVLDAVDAAVGALPNSLCGEQLEALLDRVKRPAREATPVKRRWLPTAAAATAAALIAAVAVGAVAATQRRAWTAVPTGQVLLDGEPLLQHHRLGAHGHWSLEVGPESTAQLVSPAQGALRLPAGTQLSFEQGLRLDRGNLLVSANGLTLSAGGQHVSVDGTAVLSMEPAEGVVRVTDVLNQFPSGAQMKSQWMRMSSVAVTAAVAGGGLTLFVLDGNARMMGENTPELRLAAGESAHAGDGKPGRWKAPQSSAALGGTPTRSFEATPSDLQKGDARLRAMSQPELVALVEKVLDEKEALAREREALKKKVADLDDDGHPARNYYRLQPEELLESARKGELRLRGPQLEDAEFKADTKAKEAVSLTPAEEAKVKEIFNASRDRARAKLLAIYKEIGGDPDSAASWSTSTLLGELRSKGLGTEYGDAIRQLANERAGLVASTPEGAGSAIYRAYRTYIEEDDRTLSELERLLGPRRTEELLNHENTSHSNHTFGVGPAKPK
ncbi:MAG: hypothetical protein K1X64_01685 [Myxococcaceae bacterium]|nr:hypothetical protein [Myxococcaceae bacterium]